VSALAKRVDSVHYTYTDYLSWGDEKRWELIQGTAYAMAALSDAHQTILLEIGTQFKTFLRGKKCRVYIAPFDVRLNALTLDDTVVQPDLLVVCDHSKLDGSSVKGAPDLVMEVLSPSTVKYDQVTKLRPYQQAGVREYWIVDPEHMLVRVHLLHSGVHNIYDMDDETIPVDILEGFSVDLRLVFGDLLDM